MQIKVERRKLLGSNRDVLKFSLHAGGHRFDVRSTGERFADAVKFSLLNVVKASEVETFNAVLDVISKLRNQVGVWSGEFRGLNNAYQSINTLREQRCEAIKCEIPPIEVPNRTISVSIPESDAAEFERLVKTWREAKERHICRRCQSILVKDEAGRWVSRTPNGPKTVCDPEYFGDHLHDPKPIDLSSNLEMTKITQEKVCGTV